MRRNDLPPPGAATDVAASRHHHQNVPHPPPVLWVEGQPAPTSYRDGLRKPISAPPRLPGPIYGVPGFGCSGQLQIRNELPMTLPIQPFSTSGTVFDRQLTAVDRQLTGVDRQLTGVDRQLTGVDRSPVPTAARVPHAVTPVANIVLYQGFWRPTIALKPIFSFQNRYEAWDDDIIVASLPKAGTTWTRALLYSILNRGRYPDLKKSPLQYTTPMELLPVVDFNFNGRNKYYMDLDSIPKPRVLPLHFSYASLPDSIKSKGCKMVYVWRNPMDYFISLWHFLQVMKFPREDGRQPELLPMEKCFDQFCEGTCDFGPYWDHVLGYWRASQEAPDKILFLKFDDIKGDVAGSVKKLANFLGCPFSAQEEEQGSVDHIVNFCSFENLCNLEVNKTGTVFPGVPTTAFFRKGVVGDSRNHLTPSMVERIVKITQEKWAGTGLSFHAPICKS